MSKELVLTRRDHKIIEHKGYKLIQYKDNLMGQVFYNAEIYKDDRLQCHATTGKIMSKAEAKRYIENHIEFKEKIIDKGRY